MLPYIKPQNKFWYKIGWTLQYRWRNKKVQTKLQELFGNYEIMHLISDWRNGKISGDQRENGETKIFWNSYKVASVAKSY
jgi:hypothetical protein